MVYRMYIGLADDHARYILYWEETIVSRESMLSSIATQNFRYEL